MEEQSYAKHTRVVPLFHGVLFVLIVLTFFGSLWNFYNHMFVSGQRTTDGLLVMVAVALILLFFFSRTFPLKAQDRAIRAEENLRHFALTGKLLDARLKVPQIIALRFASDDEFVALARKATDEGLSMADIKKSVKNWRADTYRV
ncbi:MAG TPA: DUF6526 family protein [Bryobacteraceae bacterium]|jgi:hypothetical protein